MGWRDFTRAWIARHWFNEMPGQPNARVASLRRCFAKMPSEHRLALAHELLAGTGRVDVDFKLLDAAHACMRETGWQLAPANAARGSDGVLEAACAEVAAQVGETLAACRAAMLAARPTEDTP